MIKQLDKDDVKFSILCVSEDALIEGNYSAIDEETDRKTAEWIRKELDNGNIWAWANVCVKCDYYGLQTTEWLGYCSYKSEEDFKESGYYENMKKAALKAMQDEINMWCSHLHWEQFLVESRTETIDCTSKPRMISSECHKLMNEYEERFGEDSSLMQITTGSGIKRIEYADEFVEWMVSKYVDLLAEARRWGYKE